jgi:hypothetical protein
MQPMRPVYRADGSFAGRAERLRYSNPVAIANVNSNELETRRAFGNLEANYQVANNFRLTGRGGFDALDLDETAWDSPTVDRTYAASANGVGKSGHTGATKYLAEGYATFEPLSSATNHLSLIGGASIEYNKSTLNYIRGEGFTSGFRTYVRNASNVTEYDGSSTRTTSSASSRAPTGRSRSLPPLGQRARPTARRASARTIATVCSRGVARLGRERGAVRARAREVVNLKLRASYGATGNQGIGDFAARALATGSPYSGTPASPSRSSAILISAGKRRASSTAGADSDVLQRSREPDGGLLRAPHVGPARAAPDPAITGFTTYWGNIGEHREPRTRPRTHHHEPPAGWRPTASRGTARSP